IAAVDRISSELRKVAQVLASTAAVKTSSVCTVQPRHPNACANFVLGRIRAKTLNQADDLVSGDDVGFLGRQLALYHMEIRPADPAGVYAQQNFAFARLRDRDLSQFERLRFDQSGLAQDAGFHHV